jgi:hypothetical protein
MKKSFVSISIVLLMCFFAGFTSIEAKATTVATFADPSNDGGTSLFTVDFRPTQMKLTGGWAYGNTGLLLIIPYNGHSLSDTWFEMTEVDITDAFGTTGNGEINFYANGTTTNPLLTISFESGHVDYTNFGADVIFAADEVEFSGSEIIPGLFSEEQIFSFTFANKTLLPGSDTFNDGFTATAAFTSSAVPEPATVCILGLGALCLTRRKK